VFLVEHHATPDALSFGVMFFHFFHDVEKQMNDFSNISTNDYQRIYFPSSRIEEQVESFQRIFSKKDTVVFLMGLDFQMRFLVERFYKKNSNNAEPRAILVGWMNAHALNSLYSHGEYYSDLVFDISDFGPMASLDFPNGAWKGDVSKRDGLP
jgi:hypothetical protein